MKQEKAIFAAGCFWGVQHQFQRVSGVLNTVVGYTGGREENPKYPEVKAHQTHHVEAIVVDYDADIVSYEDLCKVFFEIHDPAQTDGVGPDIGPQYRSEIFYLNEEQKEIPLNKGGQAALIQMSGVSSILASHHPLVKTSPLQH